MTPRRAVPPPVAQGDGDAGEGPSTLTATTAARARLDRLNTLRDDPNVDQPWLTAEIAATQAVVDTEEGAAAALRQVAEQQQQRSRERSTVREQRRGAIVEFCQPQADTLLSVADAQQRRLRDGTFADVPALVVALREAMAAYSAAVAPVLGEADASLRNTWQVERVLGSHPIHRAMPWLETMAAALTQRPDRSESG
jgi:hypothetical protein